VNNVCMRPKRNLQISPDGGCLIPCLTGFICIGNVCLPVGR